MAESSLAHYDRFGIRALLTVLPSWTTKILALTLPCCLDSAKSLHKQTQVTMQEVGMSHKQNTDICSLINKDLDGQLPKVWFSLITKQNTFSICNPLPAPKRKIKPIYSL